MEIYTVSIYILAFLLYFLASFLKPRFFPITALCFLTLGFLGNGYLIIRHIIISHRLPLTNTSETLLSAAGFIVLIFLIVSWVKPLKIKLFGIPKEAAKLTGRPFDTIGLFVSLISSLGLLLSFWFFKRPSMPLLPALQSKWLVFHVSSCIIAYSFFTIAFVTALVYLMKQDSSSTNVSAIMHRSICIGFLFLTLGIILGSIWGKSAWGHSWNWDPKETWALITWLIYASYIHGRLYEKWPERGFAGIAILGFLACLFTYIGVNYLLKGLHSYA